MVISREKNVEGKNPNKVFDSTLKTIPVSRKKVGTKVGCNTDCIRENMTSANAGKLKGSNDGVVGNEGSKVQSLEERKFK